MAENPAPAQCVRRVPCVHEVLSDMVQQALAQAQGTVLSRTGVEWQRRLRQRPVESTGPQKPSGTAESSSRLL